MKIYLKILVMTFLLIPSCSGNKKMVEKRVVDPVKVNNIPMMAIPMFNQFLKETKVNSTLEIPSENKILLYSVFFDGNKETVFYSIYPIYSDFLQPNIYQSDLDSKPLNGKSFDLLMNQDTGQFESLSSIPTNYDQTLFKFYVDKIDDPSLKKLIKGEKKLDENIEFLKEGNFKQILIHANLKSKINNEVAKPLVADIGVYKLSMLLFEYSDYDFTSQYQGTKRQIKFDSNSDEMTMDDIRKNLGYEFYKIGSNILSLIRMDRIGNSSSFGIRLAYYEKL